MTPFQTKVEFAAAREKCQKAYDQAKNHFGFARMRLMNKAFPFSIHGNSTKAGLRLTLNKKEEAYCVSDPAGFITLIPLSEEDLLTTALRMEHDEAGSFREFITGEKPKRIEKPKRKEKINLSDLKLKF